MAHNGRPKNFGAQDIRAPFLIQRQYLIKRTKLLIYFSYPFALSLSLCGTPNVKSWTSILMCCYPPTPMLWSSVADVKYWPFHLLRVSIVGFFSRFTTGRLENSAIQRKDLLCTQTTIKLNTKCGNMVGITMHVKWHVCVQNSMAKWTDNQQWFNPQERPYDREIRSERFSFGHSLETIPNRERERVCGKLYRSGRWVRRVIYRPHLTGCCWVQLIRVAIDTAMGFARLLNVVAALHTFTFPPLWNLVVFVRDTSSRITKAISGIGYRSLPLSRCLHK